MVNLNKHRKLNYESRLRSIFFGLALVVLIFNSAAALAASQSGITYQGRILKPDGTPLNGQFVQFKIQVRSPNSSNCLMFEEQQALDMRLSGGQFSLTLNDGSGARTTLLIDGGNGTPSALGLDRIFANRGAFNFDPSTCSSGSNYVPSLEDGRKLSVLFKDETMATWEQMPSQNINYVPYAIQAEQIGGFNVGSLVRVVEADGSPALSATSPLSNANYAELLLLVAGTSGSYEKAGKIAGATAPTMTTGQVLGWNGSTWTSVDPLSGVQAFAKTALPACAAGEYLRNNGTGLFVCTAPPATGGTVTQVNTSGGLTGGGFTTSGTISIAAGGVGTTQLAADSVTTAKILSANVTAAKLAADSVDSSKILDGSITGSDLNAALNLATSGTVDATHVQTRDFKLYPTGAGTNYVSLAAPVGGATFPLTFPLAQGGVGQALVNDGTGNLSWTNLSAGSQWTTQAPGINYMGGNVGIGTTSPSSALEVSGVVTASPGSQSAPAYTFSTSNSTGLSSAVPGTINFSASGTNVFQMSTSQVQSNVRMTVFNGTTAAIPSDAFGGDASTGLFNPASGTIAFSSTGSEKLRINSSGNVGIGTTAPVGALDVSLTFLLTQQLRHK